MVTKYWKLKNDEPLEPQLEQAAQLLREGEVVAFPTETVYGLGADGLNGDACRKIYAAKGRPADNPLILHISEMEEIDPLTSGLSPMAKKLMAAFWPGPMTLIVPKSSIIPEVVTAGQETVAVRFPSNQVARKLIHLAGRPLQRLLPTKAASPVPPTPRMCSRIWTGSSAACWTGAVVTSEWRAPSSIPPVLYR